MPHASCHLFISPIPLLHLLPSSPRLFLLHSSFISSFTFTLQLRLFSSSICHFISPSPPFPPSVISIVYFSVSHQHLFVSWFPHLWSTLLILFLLLIQKGHFRSFFEWGLHEVSTAGWWLKTVLRWSMETDAETKQWLQQMKNKNQSVGFLTQSPLFPAVSNEINFKLYSKLHFNCSLNSDWI